MKCKNFLSEVRIKDANKSLGFTLVELVGVIVLLALISLLSYSYIIKNINSQKQDFSEAFNKLLFQSADIYVGYNPNNYLKTDGNVYCIKFSELTDLEILSEPLLDPVTNERVSLDNYVKLEVNVDEYIYTIVNSCTEKR